MEDKSRFGPKSLIHNDILKLTLMIVSLPWIGQQTSCVCLPLVTGLPPFPHGLGTQDESWLMGTLRDPTEKTKKHVLTLDTKETSRKFHFKGSATGCFNGSLEPPRQGKIEKFL